MKQTGIFIRASDITQPYRVVFDGKIVFFARTLEEANKKLQVAIVRRTRIVFKGVKDV